MSARTLDTKAEHELVDLATFRPDGPCVLFIRPRRALSDAEMRNVMESIRHFPIPGVRQMFVPHDFELMALGEGDLKQIGYARIDTAPPEAPSVERTAP